MATEHKTTRRKSVVQRNPAPRYGRAFIAIFGGALVMFAAQQAWQRAGWSTALPGISWPTASTSRKAPSKTRQAKLFTFDRDDFGGRRVSIKRSRTRRGGDSQWLLFGRMSRAGANGGFQVALAGSKRGFRVQGLDEALAIAHPMKHASVKHTGRHFVLTTKLGRFRAIETTHNVVEGRKTCLSFLRTQRDRQIFMRGWSCGAAGQPHTAVSVACKIAKVKLAKSVLERANGDLTTGTACNAREVFDRGEFTGRRGR